MAETLGAIRYDVEVDTANMLKAEGQVDKSIQKMVGDFDKADKAVREFTETQKSMGRTVNSMGQVISKNGKIVSTATTEYRRLANTAQKGFNNLNTNISQTAAGVNRATGGFRSMNGALGQLGFQAQDVAVQLQMGTNAGIVFAQQGSQIASIFGPGGAVVGAIIAVGSAIAGALIPSLLEGSETFDEFSEKQKKASEDVIKFINQTDKASKQTALTVETGKLVQQQDELEKVIVKLNKDLSIQEKLLKLGGPAASSARVNIRALKEEIEETEQKVQEIGKTIEDVFVDTLPEATDQNGEAAEKLKAFTQALQAEVETLGMTERGLALYTAEKLGADEAAIKLINSSYDQIEAYKQEQKALDDYLDSFEKYKETDRGEVKQERRQAREEAGAERFAGSIIDRGLSDSERFAQELEKLEDLRRKDLLSQQLYDQAVVSSVKQRAQQIDETNARQAAMQARQRDLLLTSTSDIFGGIAEILHKSEGEQSDAYKAMFALSKGFAVANAALNLSLAISQALADPSALTIYQKFANYAAIASAGGALVSSISGMSYSGSREFGGPVTAGDRYRVGEGGKPEFLRDNRTGHLSMIPGENGEVIPMDQMGGSPNWTVQVNNYGSDKATANVDQDARMVRVTIGEISRQVREGTGQFPSAMKASTNVNFNADS